MTKTKLILKHKRTGEVKEVMFKISIRFANKVRKLLRNYDLVHVEGKNNSEIVQYLRTQITRYEKSPETYNISAKEIIDVATSRSKTSVEQIKKSLKLLPKRFRIGEEE